MNKIYAMTGGATGIGAAVKQQLIDRGDQVIVIDIQASDIVADLSTTEGRANALRALEEKAPDGLDGFIPCAGLGPHTKPYSLIARVNFFGSTAMIEGVRPLLEKKKGVIVVISSNSAPLPGYSEDFIKKLLSGDEEQACKLIDTLDGQTAYGGSKRALAIWMREKSAEYMRNGVRMNAVAPGVTQTAMTDGVFNDETFGSAIKEFSEMTPYGSVAQPEMIADSILFLLGPQSEFICGSVLFVDGGTDAMLRPTEF